MGSAWRIARPRPRCSTPTGRTRSARRTATCGPIGSGFWRGPRLPARSTRPGPIAGTSRSARPTGTDTGASRHLRILAGGRALAASAPSPPILVRLQLHPLRGVGDVGQIDGVAERVLVEFRDAVEALLPCAQLV